MTQSETPDLDSVEPIPEPPRQSVSARDAHAWLYHSLFLIVLLLGAIFRLRGIDWDEFQYVHPDERFLGFVENDILPVNSLAEYFDTANSTLNPMNRGHRFFVYGTLPIFLLRYMMEWTSNSGYANFASVGRPLSALFDLATVFVLYLIALRLFNRKLAVLAAAFLSFAVLPIQLSHFFTVDIFANFFIWLSVYFAVVLVQAGKNPPSTGEETSVYQPPRQPLDDLLRRILTLPTHPTFAPALLFGIFAGMALASKVSAYPVVLLLPLAAGLYLLQLPERDRLYHAVEQVLLMAFAGILFLVTFRIFQPYAFSGPGFFDLTPNPEWVEALTKLQALLVPSTGYPPAVQWLYRPVWFSWKNITLWGVGLPLGLAAWAGMLWMGWRIFARQLGYAPLIVWGWTTGHFIWQSLAFNPTMRYQLPIYPGLALLGAWALVELYSAFNGEAHVARLKSPASRFTRSLALTLGTIVLLATFLYAFAFHQIYTRDVTRLAASRWMFANLPAPLNLQVALGGQLTQQPISIPDAFTIRPNAPFSTGFISRYTGTVTEISLGHVLQEGLVGNFSGLYLQILSSPENPAPLATSVLQADFSSQNTTPYTFTIDQPILLQEQQYTLKLELLGGAQALNLCDALSLNFQTANGAYLQNLATAQNCTVTADSPYLLNFVPETSGLLTEVMAAQIVNPHATFQPVTLRLAFADQPDLSQPLAAASVTVTPGANPILVGVDNRPAFTFDPPLTVLEGQTYYVEVSLEAGSGQISLRGTAVAVESSWDDSLPYRIDNYDAYGGIFQSGYNFEMYWFDDEGKRQRFYDILDGADVVTISSSRQWGSVGRLDELYPISTTYYRNLIGCPDDRTVEDCYNVATPGMFTENLGYELIQTFTSHPTIGSFEINDQPSEEAFTVYDHPKVFIFMKTADYDPERVREILGAAPLGRRLEDVGLATPSSEQPQEVKSLLLTPEQLEAQQNGGTWSELFNSDGVLNTFLPLTVLVWYGAVFLLGAVTYPIVRLALPGLDDRGYPLARTAGVLILSYLVWLLGSWSVPVTRLTSWLVFLFILLVGAGVAYLQWGTLRREFSEKWQYFLTIEGLMLAFFLFLLLIRIGNPDLWHPWKGGEKPMDFAYLNAVIRSTTFPPYDPWFAGGYINYYYYGFVFVGVLVKWLGIVPAIAYNLILPTLFSMLAMGAFSVAWNLMVGYRLLGSRSLDKATDPPIPDHQSPIPDHPSPIPDPRSPFTQYYPYLIGLAAAVGIAVFGNLGVPRMIVRGYERLGAPPEAVLDDSFFLTRWTWAVRGFVKVIQGDSLPYRMDEWYWNPSRAIPAPGEIEPITEFPFFTFLYADLHAHMIALPITVLALAWAVSAVLARGHWGGGAGRSGPGWLGSLLGFILGGLAIGALRPTNTWDFPTYLALGMVAVGYGMWQGYKKEGVWMFLPETVGKVIKIVFGAGFLGLLSWYLFQPFTDSFALGYTKAQVWQGTHTPIGAYLTHWGLFLFLIFSWIVSETIDWMANTPVSALRKLKPALPGIGLAIVFLLVLIIILMFYFDAPVSWLVMLLAAWAAILLLRPEMSDAKRLVLFLIGTGLVLTQTVEVIVLTGDIGRMNTVFKFYIQVWVLFGVSAVAGLGWLLPRLEAWASRLRWGWQFALVALAFGAAMYPMMGSVAKIKDRMTTEAPHTLNGVAYMPFAHYNDNGVDLSLDEDYRAMQWLQENVQGSPTIIEGHTVEYRWGGRFSINTGLPAVLGWNWHQRQQRTGHDMDVWKRADEVALFYNTPLQEQTVELINRYHIRYIIVGQMEKAYYDPLGLAKFEQWDGQLWHEVYRDGETVIYEVGGGS